VSLFGILLVSGILFATGIATGVAGVIRNSPHTAVVGVLVATCLPVIFTASTVLYTM
jgi:hypothetical protein